MMSRFRIRPATLDDAPAWGRMRVALWPDEIDVDGIADLRDALGDGKSGVAFLALDGQEVPIGFAEARIRQEYINGTRSSPVGFLEAWYVVPEWRGRGVGRALVTAVGNWTMKQGCDELASDTWLENQDSQAAHARCGFEETERVVYFRKDLRRA